jgi:hypothetical protein
MLLISKSWCKYATEQKEGKDTYLFEFLRSSLRAIISVWVPFEGLSMGVSASITSV